MVTKYGAEDIKEIQELGVQINPKFKELFNIEYLPDNENIYVYKEDNLILGFLHTLNNIDDVEILNIIVKNNNRNKGIATLLIDYLLSETDKRIILEVRESNIAAINLYTKFNFDIINKRKKYYGNEDAIVMERRIVE